MPTMNFLNRIAILGMIAAASFAADIDGKWKGSAPGRGGQTMEVNMDFKSDGTKLTGSMSNQMGSTDITDGKVDGANVEFKVKREFNGNSFVMNYKGKVEGDNLKLAITVEGREMPARELTAKRVK